jgi:hypothetical protein
MTAEKSNSKDDDYNCKENGLLQEAASHVNGDSEHVNTMWAHGLIMLKL